MGKRTPKGEEASFAVCRARRCGVAPATSWSTEVSYYFVVVVESKSKLQDAGGGGIGSAFLSGEEVAGRDFDGKKTVEGLSEKSANGSQSEMSYG